MTDTGVLVLAATPIGQAGDAPPRLAAELAQADVVAAEDTRRLRRLCADLEISLRGRVVSYFEGNEHTRTPGIHYAGPGIPMSNAVSVNTLRAVSTCDAESGPAASSRELVASVSA